MNGRGREVFYSSPGIGWQAHFFHFYYLEKKGTYRKNKLNSNQSFFPPANSGAVSGLAVDTSAQRLYWSNSDTVSVADLRSKRAIRTLLKTSSIIHGLAAHAGEIYWSESDKVLR